MATARTGALRPGEGTAVLARRGDGVGNLCLDRTDGQIYSRDQDDRQRKVSQ
jgi:hypothetical protein